MQQAGTKASAMKKSASQPHNPAGSSNPAVNDSFGAIDDILDANGARELVSSKDTKLLRQSYSIAKTRAVELNSLTAVNIVVGSQSAKASKVYTAIAALLNTSISMASCDALEKYIMKTGNQLPANIIDLDDWSIVLEIARDRRGSSKKLANQLKQRTKDFRFMAQMSFAAAHTCRSELAQMRAEVMGDILVLREQLGAVFKILPKYCGAFARAQQDAKMTGELQRKLTADLAKTREAVQVLQGEVEAKDAALAQAEALREAAAVKHAEDTEALKASYELEKEEGQKATMARMVKEHEATKSALEAEMAQQLRERDEQTTAALKAKDNELAAAQAATKEMAASVQALEARLSESEGARAELTKQLEAARNEARSSADQLHSTMDGEVAALRSSVAALEAELVQAREQVVAADAETVKLQAKAQQLHQHCSDLARDLQEALANPDGRSNCGSSLGSGAPRTQEETLRYVVASYQRHVVSTAMQTAAHTICDQRGIPWPVGGLPRDDGLVPGGTALTGSVGESRRGSDGTQSLGGGRGQYVPYGAGGGGGPKLLRMDSGAMEAGYCSDGPMTGGGWSLQSPARLPTFAQYVEEAVNQIYDRHENRFMEAVAEKDAREVERLSQYRSEHVMTPMIMIDNRYGVDNPAAEALRLLQDIRVDVEIMRNNVLSSTLRQCERMIVPPKARSSKGAGIAIPAGENADDKTAGSLAELSTEEEHPEQEKFVASTMQAVSFIQHTIDADLHNEENVRARFRANREMLASLLALKEEQEDGPLSPTGPNKRMLERMSRGHTQKIWQVPRALMGLEDPAALRSATAPVMAAQPAQAPIAMAAAPKTDAGVVVGGPLDGGDSVITMDESSLEGRSPVVASPRLLEALVSNSNAMQKIADENNSPAVAPSTPLTRPYANAPVPELTPPQLLRVVKLQAVVRGFVGRRAVRRKILNLVASNQGVLVATMGTVQGESGWYTSQGMLFYFCLCAGEFVLLCGPITPAIYEVARSELERQQGPEAMAAAGGAKGDASVVSSGSSLIGGDASMTLSEGGPRRVVVDRLAIQATRTQVQVLLDTVRSKDAFIDELQREIGEVKAHCLMDLEDLSAKQREQIEEFKARVKEHKKAVSAGRAETIAVRGQFDDLRARYKALQDAVAKADPSLLQKSPEVSPKASAASVVTKAPDSPRFMRKLVKFQALVRGFTARMKANHKKVMYAAQTTGLLVALKANDQGKSGWYQAPGGDVFYFVRDDQGSWLLAAGPISRSDYDVTVYASNNLALGNGVSALMNKPSSADAGGLDGGGSSQSPVKTASGGGMSVAVLRKNLAEATSFVGAGEVLRRCNFELAVEHEDVHGELYIANKTNRLFVAVSVDSLLIDSQFANESSMASVSNKVDEATNDSTFAS